MVLAKVVFKLMNTHTKLAISIFESRADGIFHSLGHLLLDQASGQRAEGLVEEIVTAVTDGEFEGIDFDVDVLDAEQTALRLGGGSLIVDDSNSSGDTPSTEEDVSETRVFEFLCILLARA